MKTTQKWTDRVLLVGVAALVLAVGLIVVGCDSGGSGGGNAANDQLLGTWKGSGSPKVKFTNEGHEGYVCNYYTGAESYSVSGNVITIGGSATVKFVLSGSTITFSDCTGDAAMASILTGAYTKQ
jgi:hypothetical protein